MAYSHYFIHRYEYCSVQKFCIVSGNLGCCMPHDFSNDVKTQPFVQQITCSSMSADMSMKRFADIAKTCNDFQVGVVSLVADGGEIVLILLGDGGCVFK